MIKVGFVDPFHRKIVHCKRELDGPCLMSEESRCALAFMVSKLGQVVHHVLVDNSASFCESMEGTVNASTHTPLVVCWCGKILLVLEVFWDLAQLESHALWIFQQTLEVHHLDIQCTKAGSRR